MGISDIYQGWKNSIFKKDDVESFALVRLKVCYSCDKLDNVLYAKCSMCGCPLSKLVRTRKKEMCKLGKWSV